MLAALAGFIVVLPAIIFGIPNNNDLANHYHFAIPFYDALRQGEIYPGWLATSNFGYGDVVVRFYPPALYYVLAATRAITGNWYAGTLLAVSCLSMLGSLGAYFWARLFVSHNLAAVAGLFYALMPYHLAEFYQAALLAEFAGGAALLFALAFTKKICDEPRWRNVAGLAAAYAALTLTHLPLAVFGSITLFVYAILNVRLNNFKLASARLASAAILAVAASSFYWMRMVPEMKWILADGPNPDSLLDYRRNFLFSTLSPEKQETLWWMALLALATFLMCLPAVVTFTQRVQTVPRRALAAVAALLVFSVFMSSALSRPVWALVPYLQMTQHPFRWLAITSVAAPILMAASVPFWSAQLRQRQRSMALIASGLVLIAVTFSLSQTVRGATFLSRPTFEKMLAPLYESASIVHWLPVWASSLAPNKASYEKCVPPNADVQVAAGDRRVRVTRWSGVSRSFEVDAGPQGDVRVATFYYPHWIATAGGNALSTRPAQDGTLLISLPSEKIAVNLEFREPLRTKLAAVISIISWTLISSLLIFGSLIKRRDYESIRRDATN